jgi:hypothetical protein
MLLAASAAALWRCRPVFPRRFESHFAQSIRPVTVVPLATLAVATPRRPHLKMDI